jgi:hypothetical protein
MDCSDFHKFVGYIPSPASKCRSIAIWSHRKRSGRRMLHRARSSSLMANGCISYGEAVCVSTEPPAPNLRYITLRLVNEHCHFSRPPITPLDSLHVEAVQIYQSDCVLLFSIAMQYRASTAAHYTRSRSSRSFATPSLIPTRAPRVFTESAHMHVQDKSARCATLSTPMPSIAHSVLYANERELMVPSKPSPRSRPCSSKPSTQRR